jgi:hypothetical protein
MNAIVPADSQALTLLEPVRANQHTRYHAECRLEAAEAPSSAGCWLQVIGAIVFGTGVLLVGAVVLTRAA